MTPSGFAASSFAPVPSDFERIALVLVEVLNGFAPARGVNHERRLRRISQPHAQRHSRLSR